MLEQRVGKLEEKVERIETILVRLEPQVVEILRSGAKQAEVTKLQQDTAEVKGRLVGSKRLHGVGRSILRAQRPHHAPNRVDDARHRLHHLGSWVEDSLFAMNYLRK